jgi:hypothetical protein
MGNSIMEADVHCDAISAIDGGRCILEHGHKIDHQFRERPGAEEPTEVPAPEVATLKDQPSALVVEWPDGKSIRLTAQEWTTCFGYARPGAFWALLRLIREQNP